VTALNLRADHRQGQALSPRLQHAVRLLQMSSLDFSAMVRDSLGQNPFLETDEGADVDDPPAESAVPAADYDEADGSGPNAAAADVAIGANEGNDGNDRDLWQTDIASRMQWTDDGETSVLDTMAVDVGLNTHLRAQLNLLPLSARDLALACTIVESLDDDGYLRTPLEELLSVPEFELPPTLQEMQVALERVQSLEPSGVAARGVAECLLLQLQAIDCPATRQLARRIITDHLNALAARDVPGLARRLGESAERVEAVCDRIRRLDPRPGWRIGASHAAYVVPDVVVNKVRGRWAVQLNPAIVPKVRLNQVYATLFQCHRTAHDAELGAHLQQARWTLRNVEQRFSTILQVATAIVKRQSNFLDYGDMAMKPLVLREIADEVGIHESTVSRVTNNKYMATPVGVFELKYFFSRAMISANGSTCSGTAIRGLVQDIIEGERHDKPLSDAEITRQLAQQGLIVARRTVTKYRQMLKIEAVDRRRRHA
jgi:RNA polymerase sigma-54 factor